jgi:hypothetical protein
VRATLLTLLVVFVGVPSGLGILQGIHEAPADSRMERIQLWRSTARCMRDTADSLIAAGREAPAAIQQRMVENCTARLRERITTDYPTWTQSEVSEFLAEQAYVTLWTIYQERQGAR